MRAYTGTEIDLGALAGPSLVDMAVSLGRMPRFAGGTRVWPWTVLHHSMVVDTIIGDTLIHSHRPYRDSVRLYGLLHDAHESLTGDVPTPFKTGCMREIQDGIDKAIWHTLGLPPMPTRYAPVIEEADRMALHAEAIEVGPPGLHSNVARSQDRAIVRMIAERYSSPYDSSPPQGKLCIDWIDDINLLIESCVK